MIERYVDIDFDNRINCEIDGGFDNEHDATIIRLKVIDENAKYYLDLGLFSDGFNKYRTEALPVENGYATYSIPRDLTHGHLHVQGIMKIGDICRKTATISIRLGGSINALDELPESHPSWADSVDERIDGLEMGMKDAVTYTPQTLTEEQKSQARTNIGALDVNIETTPVDIGVGLGSRVYYVKSGWLKPCPDNADKELILQYRLVFEFIGSQYFKSRSKNILSEAKSAYALYQKGLASESIIVAKNPLKAAQVYVTWNLTTRSNKHYFYYAQVSTAYNYNCTYCVEDDALTSESYQRAIYRSSNGVGEQDSVSQFRMYTNPTEDMHIATKQYVDTAKTEAQQLGLTTATPGQLIKVKTVQDGKPTEWEAVDMPSGEEWEKIKEITIAEGAEESNALTINADENGNTFRLKKARLCAKFPAYTGTSTIPNFSFAMLNGKTVGENAPLLYTSVWPKISTSGIAGTIYYVDVSGAQQIEHAQVSTNAIWSNDASNAYNKYGSSNDQRKTIYGDMLWAKPITSIGGTSMLIYPGCHFVLYGVRE